jgi:hypothetical protein
MNTLDNDRGESGATHIKSRSVHQKCWEAALSLTFRFT